MFEKTLPIGSVVSMFGQDDKYMILGYLRYFEEKQGQEDNDYCACSYPRGYWGEESPMVFLKHADIEHIYALGYQNQEQFDFRRDLEDELLDEEMEKEAYTDIEQGFDRSFEGGWRSQR